MKILALDTATSGCSVATRVEGKTTASAFEMMTRGQSEALMPMVLKVLSEAAMQVGDFDLIAVTCGPGAFTGLRIGLAAARGLALASGVPCCGVTSTQAIAEAANLLKNQDQSLLVALDSKRADIYIQAFGPKGAALCAPEALGLDHLSGRLGQLGLTGPVVVAGDAATRAMTQLQAGGSRQIFTQSTAPAVPDARYVAEVAERFKKAGLLLDGTSPLYLRPPDAVIPKNGGRLRP